MAARPGMTISGLRFEVDYLLAADDAPAARTLARAIAVEQTVEFPPELLPPGDIAAHVVGRVEALTPHAPGGFLATLSYAVETVGGELPQLLNVMFGNVSLLPGIRVTGLRLPEAMLTNWAGPRFGVDGLRARCHGSQNTPRPMVMTVIKPMGLSAHALAERVYQMALGGVDAIKDDHGLANQPFAPFEERVSRCMAAVSRANTECGGHTVYVPNITGPFDQLLARARFAQAAGAGAVLVCPALSGFDALRALAADPSLSLPLVAHPAFLGGWLSGGPHTGIAHGVLLGQLMRLAGADAVVYPHFGGRFGFSQAECLAIAQAATGPMGPIKPILPCPGGGMTLDRMDELLAVYGPDVMLLLGGDVFRRSPDLTANCRYVRQRLDAAFTRQGEIPVA